MPVARPGIGRIVELPATLTFFIPDGRATIGNHDDLLVDATMTRQQLARQHQAMRHICAGARYRSVPISTSSSGLYSRAMNEKPTM